MTIFFNRIGNGLGDLWAVVNFLLAESERIGKPVRLHRMSGAEGDFDATDIVTRISKLLDSRGQIVITDDAATQDVPQNETWMARQPYFPTKAKWVGAERPRICYQIDGRSQSGLKNMPPEDLEKIRSAFHSYWLVPVGLPDSIEVIVQLLSRCSFFLGVCSGVSHIAHSVRVPTFLVEYQFPLKTWHGANDYVHCYGTDDAIRRMKEHTR